MRIIAAVLATLVLLVLALTLALWPWPAGPDALCRVPDVEREATAALAAARDREASLRTELAGLREGLAVRQADCPQQAARVEPPVLPPPAVIEPPPAAPPVAMAPPQAPAPPATPRVEMLRLPGDLDQRRDLGFLRGCWVTDPFRHQRAQTVAGVSEYCFDAEGRGILVWRRGDAQCRTGAQVAIVAGNGLDIADGDTTCSDGSRWYGDHLVCHAGMGGVALCSGETFDPATGRVEWTVRLHRRS